MITAFVGNKDSLQELDIENGKIREFPLFTNTDVRSLCKDRKVSSGLALMAMDSTQNIMTVFVKFPLDGNGYLSTAHIHENKKGLLMGHHK